MIKIPLIYLESTTENGQRAWPLNHLWKGL